MPSSSDSSSIGREEMEFREYEPAKQKGFCGENSSDRIFLKITGIVAGVAVLVLVIVLPIYFTVIEPNNMTETAEAPKNERFDCIPEGGGTQQECENRGCIWSGDTTEGDPSCYFSGSRAYMLESDSSSNAEGITSVLRLNENFGNYYGQQFLKLTVATTFVSATTVRVKIQPEASRYEVPMDHPPVQKVDLNSALYTAEHTNEGNNFGVKITRSKTARTLFDSSVGQLMFADQFLQISTKVASEYVYGFGEHMHRSFKHDMNWKTYGMFTYDQNVALDYNLYGVQAYFTCMEGDGNAYGVFFVNSNAMEIHLQPTPAITYRTIGGLLDFYIFLGPSPEEVTQQYMQVIGRPYFPPYWSLGFQLCRWNYGSLTKLSEVVNRNLESGIPYDVQYSDIDYMQRQLDFTIDNETYNGITEFVLDLKREHKMKYIIILDPAISGNETEPYPPFDNGIRDNIFIKYENGDLAWGKVWPDLPNITVDDSKDKEYKVENYRAHTAYPDFFHPNATNWWKELILDFRDKIEFDGLWIDMNEPTSFTNGTTENICPEHKYDQPKYYPNLVAEKIYDLTICMQTMQYNSKNDSYTQHYNLHSLYGWSQVNPTLEACRESTGERCLVLTRSTFPGSGKNAGHWLGDNKSNWEHLRASIIGMMEFSLFGFAYNGADVCGFFLNTTKELCLRWMQVGAFYPFYRNHNVEKTVDQDPAVFGNEFPEDTKTYRIESQFLWGPALLITAVMEENARSVTGYFPKGRWYNYNKNGTELPESGEVVLPTELNEINVHVFGGYIIPTQEVAKNTYYSRQNPLGLVVALDTNYRASGQLFWDDGSSIDTIANETYIIISFTCVAPLLNITVSKKAPADLDVSSLYFGKILIFGVSGNVINVVVESSNGVRMEQGSGMGEGSGIGEGSGLDFNWEQEDGTISITNLGLGLNENHYVTWESS